MKKLLLLALVLVLSSSVKADPNIYLKSFMKVHFNCGTTKEELETARTQDGLNVVQTIYREIGKAKTEDRLRRLVKISKGIPQETFALLSVDTPENKEVINNITNALVGAAEKNQDITTCVEIYTNYKIFALLVKQLNEKQELKKKVKNEILIHRLQGAAAGLVTGVVVTAGVGFWLTFKTAASLVRK